MAGVQVRRQDGDAEAVRDEVEQCVGVTDLAGQPASQAVIVGILVLAAVALAAWDALRRRRPAAAAV